MADRILSAIRYPGPFVRLSTREAIAMAVIVFAMVWVRVL